MSLIPEKPLLFFPHVAVALGLHEAILLQTLKEIAAHQPGEAHNGYAWHELAGARVLELLPFWSEAELRTLANRLRDQGVLLMGNAPLSATSRWRFAFNERPQPTARPAPEPGSLVMPRPPARPQGSAARVGGRSAVRPRQRGQQPCNSGS